MCSINYCFFYHVTALVIIYYWAWVGEQKHIQMSMVWESICRALKSSTWLTWPCQQPTQSFSFPIHRPQMPEDLLDQFQVWSLSLHSSHCSPSILVSNRKKWTHDQRNEQIALGDRVGLFLKGKNGTCFSLKGPFNASHAFAWLVFCSAPGDILILACYPMFLVMRYVISSWL